MSAQNEKPIIFSTPMIQAILSEQKTQTRRVLATTMKQWKGQQPLEILPMKVPNEWVGLMSRNPSRGLVFKCRYGQVGDRLWVREGFAYRDTPESESLVVYRADQVLGHYKWRPSIHMPRWASRITLEITEVRVERVQEITEEDAMKEGCPSEKSIDTDGVSFIYKGLLPTYWFQTLWDSLNAKRGYPWSYKDLPDNLKTGCGRIMYGNPWVWVISFKVV